MTDSTENSVVGPAADSSAPPLHSNTCDSPPQLPERTRLTERKSVRFDSVHIHEHEVALGDHPATVEGPPLTIDWDNVCSQSVRLDDYERGREHLKRNSLELRIPPDIRRCLLRDSYSEGQFRQAEAEARKVRSDRAVSNALVELEGVEMARQWVGRKWRKWQRRKEPPSAAQEWLDERKKSKKTAAIGVKKSTTSSR